jgi:DNA-binding NarL/FixJ family response regulator
MEKTKIFLVDDHALVRAGIRTLINQIPDCHVLDEASGIDETMAKLAQLKPDIVVTDITMGADNGLDLVKRIKDKYKEIVVVILSMHASGELVSEALKLGAAAYLLKDAAPAELEIALHAVVRNETYLSPAVSTKMIERFLRPEASGKNALDMLTPRQIQILTMIASRKGTKEIAFELGLSEKTIAAHRAQIMERTGVRDMVGLALFAVRHGLVKSSG